MSEHDAAARSGLSEEKRAELLALDEEAAERLLDSEDPEAVSLATEFVLAYSHQVGKLLQQDKEYLHVLTPGKTTSGIEIQAMRLVRQAVEEELADAE
ncbi:hypothetical protein LJB82_03410 [Desulfovibrio sp. OttesenSCG-928-M16]|nr:hypothetical protein [Desulfovibrio sp. OttesenSCG-928-M16]